MLKIILSLLLKWLRKMRDIIKILENIENKLTEKAFPSEEEVENKIVSWFGDGNNNM